MNKNGIVYLIGAGPGDPGLFTIKGKECLEKADVVIYDYLVNPALLLLAREEAEKIYVGKKRGHKEMPQGEINRLLADKAKTGRVVARLKGGDPFIFGRGGEEAEELAKLEIPFEIVPGITSAAAVAAYAGIPLTHRDFTSSFVVVTGHEDPKKEKSKLSWEALAKTGTIVFLMGVRRIEGNMTKLIEFGKSPETPVAVITWGTFPKQETTVGTLGDIGKIVRARRIKPPAIIVVGEVVNLRETINWFETKPLFGKKVLVTRARNQSSVAVKLLEEQGAEAIEFPTIEIVPPESWDELDRAIDSLNTYDWIIFTSVNGVLFFFERLKKNRKDLRELKGIKIATIGEQTAKSVENLGLDVDIMPNDFRAEGIVQGFRGIDMKAKRILIPRAKEAREMLPLELTRMGAEVQIVAAYETKKPRSKKTEAIREMLREGKIDIVTFASSSTVKNFLSIFKKDREILSKTLVACIGPITAEACRESGIKPGIVCEKYTIEELTREIASYFETHKHKHRNPILSKVDQKLK
jgi:uroporphyrinogen III methyltransferase/synthase